VSLTHSHSDCNPLENVDFDNSPDQTVATLQGSIRRITGGEECPFSSIEIDCEGEES
jgi:hypothetical protein